MSFFDPTNPLSAKNRTLPPWPEGAEPVYATWTLADSLPKGAIVKLKARRIDWLSDHPKPWSDETEKEYYFHFAKPIHEMMDRGFGACLLRDPKTAMTIAETLLADHGGKYRLHSFVIMPNHVHVLASLLGDEKLPKILQSWKGESARKMNLQRGEDQGVWQQESWDRPIKDQLNFHFALNDIRSNPLRARLPSSDFLLWENTER